MMSNLSYFMLFLKGCIVVLTIRKLVLAPCLQNCFMLIEIPMAKKIKAPSTKPKMRKEQVCNTLQAGLDVVLGDDG